MEIDPTVVAFETINFVVLVAILRRFLFRPVREALEKRRGEIEAVRSAADQRQSEAADKQSEYEALAAELRAQEQTRLDEAVARGRAQADAIITDARKEARQRLEDAGTEVQAARRRALDDLEREVAALAAAAAQRVIGHLGVPNVSRAFARRGAHALADRLSDAPPTAIDVAHGTGDDAGEIERELRAVFGPSTSLALVEDASIVAGVRLHANGHEVEASASASLAGWYHRQVAGPEALEAPLPQAG